MDALFAKINNPIVVYIILIVFALGWLLSKSKELAGWKDLFSKDRSEELKKAREELKDLPEEAEFYAEAMRQEIFHTATRIHCNKKYRRICQKLVTDGVSSVEGIRRAWSHIYENNSRAEVRFSWTEKIMAAFLILIGLYGILATSISLVNIASLFDVAGFPNTLFILSTGVLCVFFSLQLLLPMIIALEIRKRLKERKGDISSSSSAEESPPSVQDT
ncbi:hypothetical protein KKHLCK_10355 [Candidatus Electrothrix laxa]